MNEPLPPTSDHSVNRLIAEYLQAVEAGNVPSREELLAQHPAHAEELRRFFADFDRMDRGAASLRFASPHTSDYSEARPVDLPKVRYFGDYELLEEIARGGMGVVYKARQVSLSRLVALKMLLKGEYASEKDAARFQAEAEAAAGLDHPNIVPIYEIGTHEGRQYLAMKFIEGQSLAKVDRADARTEATRLLTIAKAVHFAHQRGVLHRDLKPGNILVDDAGTLFVADFGLAKRVDAQASLSETGDVIGTPRYMAPEQANGKKGLTTAVDTYALGVILYERLTGRTPHQGQTLLEVLRQLREETPANPRSLLPALDRDLETICMKCLEKEPGQRYATTGDLADELERWLKGEPIQARPVGQMERAWRWCKRNPVVSGLSGGIAAVLLLATGISLGLANWALQEKHKADVFSHAAFLNEMQARQNSDHSENVLAQSILIPFDGGFWDLSESIQASQLQIPLLWQLSENRGEQVWFKTVKEALKDSSTTRQLLNNSQILLHAAVGLDLGKRDLLADYLLALLDDSDWKNRHTDISLLLVSLGGLNEADAEKVGYQLVLSIEQDKNFSNLKYLARALGTLTNILEPNTAGHLANRLLKVMVLQKHVEHVKDLAHIVNLFADRVDPNTAEQLARQILTLIDQKQNKFMFLSCTPEIIQTLCSLTERLEPVIGVQLQQRAASQIMAELEGIDSSYYVVYLIQGLDLLAKQMEPAEAGQLFRGVAIRYLAVLKNVKGSSDFEEHEYHRFAAAIEALAGHLEPTTAELLASIMLSAVEKKKNFRSHPHFEKGLEILAGRLEPPAAELFANRLLTLLDREQVGFVKLNVEECLEVLAGRIKPDAARLFASRLLAKMEKQKDYLTHMSCLVKCLTVLETADAVPLLQKTTTKLLAEINDQPRNYTRLPYLCQYLGILAAQLEHNSTTPILHSAITRLQVAMKLQKDPIHLSILAQSLGVLSSRLEKDSTEPLLQSAITQLLIAMEQANQEKAVIDQVMISTEGDILTVKVVSEPNIKKHFPVISILAQSLVALTGRLESNKQDALFAQTLFAVTGNHMPFRTKNIMYPDDRHLLFWLQRASPTIFAQRLAAGFSSLNGLPPAAFLVNLARAAEPFPARFSDEFMVELLHRPIAVGPWRRAILDVLGTKHRRYFRDQWDFVRYAQEKKLPLDFTAAPKRRLTGAEAK